jgi:hypothetical protein
MIEDTLSRFSTLERSRLLDKISTIARYLTQVCGHIGANILLDIVSKSPPDVDKTLALFEDPGIKEWVQRLNRKYVAIYEGVFPPFPHDWFRISWSTSLNTTYGVPFIGVKIMKRNGETVFLEQPFASGLKLINYLLRRIQSHLNKTEGQLSDDEQKELEKTRELTNILLGKYRRQMPMPAEAAKITSTNQKTN